MAQDNSRDAQQSNRIKKSTLPDGHSFAQGSQHASNPAHGLLPLLHRADVTLLLIPQASTGTTTSDSHRDDSYKLSTKPSPNPPKNLRALASVSSYHPPTYVEEKSHIWQPLPAPYPSTSRIAYAQEGAYGGPMASYSGEGSWCCYRPIYETENLSQVLQHPEGKDVDDFNTTFKSGNLPDAIQRAGRSSLAVSKVYVHPIPYHDYAGTTMSGIFLEHGLFISCSHFIEPNHPHYEDVINSLKSKGCHQPPVASLKSCSVEPSMNCDYELRLLEICPKGDFCLFVNISDHAPTHMFPFNQIHALTPKELKEGLTAWAAAFSGEDEIIRNEDNIEGQALLDMKSLLSAGGAITKFTMMLHRALHAQKNCQPTKQHTVSNLCPRFTQLYHANCKAMALGQILPLESAAFLKDNPHHKNVNVYKEPAQHPPRSICLRHNISGYPGVSGGMIATFVQDTPVLVGLFQGEWKNIGFNKCVAFTTEGIEWIKGVMDEEINSRSEDRKLSDSDIEIADMYRTYHS
ncbi:MAG: hypothetical protein M1835_001552 [Candelina submexicana]|nr:MAG: hypothetical protein M1835_001552 [Candelina submexicana]